MQKLIDYVSKHSIRGSCTCDQCFDAPVTEIQPEGHTADMVFFKVATANKPTAREFSDLIQATLRAEGLNPMDGKEHGYMELGAAIGDQGIALQFMGLGALLGLWKILSMKTVLGSVVTDEQNMQAAGQGMLSIRTLST